MLERFRVKIFMGIGHLDQFFFMLWTLAVKPSLYFFLLFRVNIFLILLNFAILVSGLKSIQMYINIYL